MPEMRRSKKSPVNFNRKERESARSLLTKNLPSLNNNDKEVKRLEFERLARAFAQTHKVWENHVDLVEMKLRKMHKKMSYKFMMEQKKQEPPVTKQRKDQARWRRYYYKNKQSVLEKRCSKRKALKREAQNTLHEQADHVPFPVANMLQFPVLPTIGDLDLDDWQL